MTLTRFVLTPTVMTMIRRLSDCLAVRRFVRVPCGMNDKLLKGSRAQMFLHSLKTFTGETFIQEFIKNYHEKKYLSIFFLFDSSCSTFDLVPFSLKPTVSSQTFPYC